MKRIVFLIICAFACYSFAAAQSLPTLDKVRQIKLLFSNQEEIEKILDNNKPEKLEAYPYDEMFTMGDSKVLVEYSPGKCSPKSLSKWDVAGDIAIGVTIFPDVLLKPDDLGIKIETADNPLGYAYQRYRVINDHQEEYNDYKQGISLLMNKGNITEITFYPLPNQQRNLSCRYKNIPAAIMNIVLSTKEIPSDCSTSVASNNACSITVLTIAKDIENDMLVYAYQVSGGKIIGTGEKVLWDLSGVKSGTYTISAGADDGCGFCGNVITKTVTVK